MKTVLQLDADGYFVGTTTADESPLEPGVYLMPAGTIDEPAPTVPDGTRAKWDGAWVFENTPEPVTEQQVDLTAGWTYAEWRLSEYPSFSEYLDGVVKGDQAQIDQYIADCLAVKAKYPKP